RLSHVSRGRNPRPFPGRPRPHHYRDLQHPWRSAARRRRSGGRGTLPRVSRREEGCDSGDGQVMSSNAPEPADARVSLARDRTGMAMYRTQLALDRTTLAWIRTTLTMASFGFGMVAFFRTIEERSPTAESMRLHRGAILMGTTLILLGIV